LVQIRTGNSRCTYFVWPRRAIAPPGDISSWRPWSNFCCLRTRSVRDNHQEQIELINQANRLWRAKNFR
jgi:hypothetical protein